jgi:hypothetical protein
MSQTPSLEQYPGYFPQAKPPFWNRTKAAIVAGLAGLVIGLLVAAGGSASPEEPAAADDPPVAEGVDVSDEEIADEVADAVVDETARMQDKLEQQKAKAKARLEDAKARAERAEQLAIRRAVAQVRAKERAKAARAVAAAQAEAEDQAPVPFTSGGGTDPRFSYCYEANDAGYGPYYQGQDPEYDWYDDADGDGVVCE